MPNEKKAKSKCVEYLRHAEYYDMQNTFDELYARSQAGEIFDGLMDVILSRENILLAYRNIKSNTGSFTPGTDKLKISDIGKLTADEVTARVCKIVKGGKNGYTPRSVRRFAGTCTRTSINPCSGCKCSMTMQLASIRRIPALKVQSKKQDTERRGKTFEHIHRRGCTREL